MSKILSFFIILCLSIVFIVPAGAEAREIWLNPVEAGKKGVGDWGGVKFKKEVHFHWRVPDDFDDNTGTAVLVLIGMKDQDLGYRVNVSVTQNGQQQDIFQDTEDSLEALVTGQLHEINLSEILPTLTPGDYVTLNFERVGKKGKAMIVGMRYQYIGTGFEGEIDSLIADIAALQAKDTELMNKDTELMNKDTTLMNDVAALQTENSGQASAIATLQTENSAQATAIGNLQSENTSQATSITALQAKDTTLMNDVSALQTEQGVQNGNISTLQAQVAALPDVSGLVTLFSGVSRIGNDIFFDGVNVNIRSGQGATNGSPPGSGLPIRVNGTGNLIVGYNEVIDPYNGDGTPVSRKVGSHNIVVGAGHNYSSYGGLVAGSDNIISNFYASVTGGRRNVASAGHSSVNGGELNTASGFLSHVSSGENNTASGFRSSVSGGNVNTASGNWSSVSGGGVNTASGNLSSVSGGQANEASGGHSSVSGGISNEASGFNSSVSGGQTPNATGTNDWRAGSLFESN
jgi:hypothetical protein